MMSDDLPFENISTDAFNQLLEHYPSLIKSLSDSKAPKTGQKSLLELDRFRYDDAVKLFGGKDPKRAMNHDDVKTLVDWKIRHGKFRPTLPKLVASNDEETVKDTISTAMASYWRTSDTAAAVDGISKLKGIGPATASLLLSVHDPEHVIFFSDEAFWWLCCGGKKDVIKYNTKEYKELNQSVQMLAKRLDVGATDIEKVAYVLMKDERSPTRKTTEPISPPMTKSAAPKGKAGVKRKEKPEGDDKPGQPLRRSKRGKQS